MGEKLFSYGTLQIENVQLEKFGRKLAGDPDALVGYEIRDCLIKDPEVVNTSGEEVHPIACFIDSPNDEVSGTVFDVTSKELYKTDKYEVDDYKRIKCILKSGTQAWVYVQNGLNIRVDYFQHKQIRLELFEDRHVAELCKKAQDSRIWKHHRSGFHSPDIFKSIAIEKAKKDIANKTRYMFVIYYQNEIVGSTSYYNVDLKNLTLYIGYTWFHPDYWGEGINTIVKKLMLSYVFKQLKFKRISFCIDSENLRSRGAIEKLNIPFEGILKKHQVRPDGSSRDSAVYAITDEIWDPKF